MSLDVASIPTGWRIWSDDNARVVLVYRPDIFDTSAFPPPCLPTIYLTNDRRRPRSHRTMADSWEVTLFLEPDVSKDGGTFDSRQAALDRMIELADSFASGELEYRSLYQVPRDAYLDKLDDLTGLSA